MTPAGGEPIAAVEPDGTAESAVHGERAVPGRRRPLALKVGAAVVAILVGYVAITFFQVWGATTEDHATRSGAIVVLGAAQYNGTPSPVLRERLAHALLLYRRGLAPQIVVTGGRQPGDRYTEATAGYDYLRAHGVADAAIRKEVQGRSTYQSLAAAARFLRAEGIDEVVLVSSAAHGKRLEEIAGEIGLQAHVSPASHRATVQELARETVAVSVGRIISFRRLDRLDH